MAEGLPKDLIKTTKELGFGSQRSAYVDINDIRQLWKVYATKSHVFQDVAGRRLENLFWRIWSARDQYQRLKVSTLAKLFLRISEERLRRVSPRLSPPNFLDTKVRDMMIESVLTLPVLSNSSSLSPKKTNSTSNSYNGRVLSPRKVSFEGQTLDEKTTQPAPTRAPLPPILKKPTTTSPPGNDAPKTARIVIQDPNDKQAADTISTPTMSSSKPVASLADPDQKQATRKKPSFVVTTPSRRNVLIRRKSSQTSPTVEAPPGNPLTAPDPEVDVEPPKQKPNQDPPKMQEPDPRLHHPAGGLSWESLYFLQPTKRDQTDTVPASTTDENASRADGRRSSPPPTAFNTSSIHHHYSSTNSPETNMTVAENNRAKTTDDSRSASQSQQASTSTSPTVSLVDRDFRVRWAEQRRRRQEAISASARSSGPPSPALSPLMKPTTTPQSTIDPDQIPDKQQVPLPSSSSSLLYRPESQLSFMIQRSKAEGPEAGAVAQPQQQQQQTKKKNCT